MQRVDERQNGQTLKLAPGEVFEIVLAENPTTGHRWYVAATGAPFCTLQSDAYEPPTGQATPGRGGLHRWKFQAAEPGAGAIELVYRRPWEKDTSPARTFRLHVEVRKGVSK